MYLYHSFGFFRPPPRSALPAPSPQCLTPLLNIDLAQLASRSAELKARIASIRERHFSQTIHLLRVRADFAKTLGASIIRRFSSVSFHILFHVFSISVSICIHFSIYESNIAFFLLKNNAIDHLRSSFLVSHDELWITDSAHAGNSQEPRSVVATIRNPTV
jgi:hypothetical protein